MQWPLVVTQDVDQGNRANQLGTPIFKDRVQRCGLDTVHRLR